MVPGCRHPAPPGTTSEAPREQAADADVFRISFVGSRLSRLINRTLRLGRGWLDQQQAGAARGNNTEQEK